MVRQCAWCLRLIDSEGERVSHLPLPKLYKASHGICGVCGALWLEQIMEPDKAEAYQRTTAHRVPTYKQSQTDYADAFQPWPSATQTTPSETAAHLALELQQKEQDTGEIPIFTCKPPLHN
ncbi:hypothetical protein EI42_03730 [Thermosporothrix hazakensis]|uniref:Uncharacterized protein n=1 Tax=Thermosporothrix hazakensis TaxID=644383 RepID=A0A326U4Z0_THEHA|nr:hypothetical protein [Thermosporothrix hazakensis]PZW26578.1 hypothetical protein EI42_03730 [Thermosporothrix hazakensis]GCE47720.1 hypothetical protein KTH_25890 [Thermosporothrix hazakensis]